MVTCAHRVIDADKINRETPSAQALADAVRWAESHNMACSLDPVKVSDGSEAFACVTPTIGGAPDDPSVDVSYGADPITAYVHHVHLLKALTERLLVPSSVVTEGHINYPHEPGYLIDCAACESKCHCIEGNAECVWSGHDDVTPEELRTEDQLREWLVEEITVPYSDVLTDSGWPSERKVTRWIADGYGSVDDAVNTYRRHGKIAEADDVARCPACGDPIDYCRGHGAGSMGQFILDLHDDDDHSECHILGCEAKCPEFHADGSCIHSDHMAEAQR